MHYINEQNREERRKKLEIYILRQVNTLDKGFKLSYACKVFHCCWQTIPTIVSGGGVLHPYGVAG